MSHIYGRTNSTRRFQYVVSVWFHHFSNFRVSSPVSDLVSVVVSVMVSDPRGGAWFQRWFQPPAGIPGFRGGFIGGFTDDLDSQGWILDWTSWGLRPGLGIAFHVVFESVNHYHDFSSPIISISSNIFPFTASVPPYSAVPHGWSELPAVSPLAPCSAQEPNIEFWCRVALVCVCVLIHVPLADQWFLLSH